MNHTFSIIVPSYNQPNYIESTCLNLAELKQQASSKNMAIELLLYDSCSNTETQTIIEKYKYLFDVVVIEKDKGQYDAINNGIKKCTGDYWTWLNTDDLIDIDGFFKLSEIVNQNQNINYIYGGIDYIDENGLSLKSYESYQLDFKTL